MFHETELTLIILNVQSSVALILPVIICKPDIVNMVDVDVISHSGEIQRGTAANPCVIEERRVLPPVLSPAPTERGRFEVFAPDAKNEKVEIVIEPSSKTETPSDSNDVETEY